MKPPRLSQISIASSVVIASEATRRIALGLRKLRGKVLENPWKKYDNIPL